MKCAQKLFLATPLLCGLLVSCGTSPDTNPFLTQNPTRVPTIRLDNPATANEKVDDSYTFNVAFGAVVLGDTWTLHYMSEATAAKGGSIVQDIAVSNHTIAWQTTSLPSGTYYFFGELHSFNGTITATAPGSIVIDHPQEATNNSPVVTLVSPSGGSIQPGTTETVRFTGTDANGDTLTYRLELSADAGSTWSSLADNLSGTTYDWVVPSTQTPGLSYRMRVTATDSHGATDSDVSDRVFAIQ